MIGNNAALRAFAENNVAAALAHELNVAQEKFRLANLSLRDLTGPAPSGLSAADSDLAIRQAHQGCVQAYNEWLAVLGRWTSFVKFGSVLEDANPNTEKPMEPRNHSPE